MNCQDCQELFSLYLDGEIDRSSRAGVDAHLLACQHCGREWQAFKKTVELVRNLPMAQVPPDFLVGIRQKLEPQSSWQKIKTSLSRLGSKQLTLSSAFAMLAITLVAASLLQMLPLLRTSRDNQCPTPMTTARIADNDRPAAETPRSQATASDQKHDRQDFYPGVPPLSKYAGNEEPAVPRLAMGSRNAQHIPVVDFVSTSSNHGASSYLDLPLPPHHQPPAINPDLLITIRPAPRSEQIAIVQQLVQSQLWRAELYNHNTLLLSVPSSSFDQLLQICCNDKTSFTPEYARSSRYISMKRYLTVAVTLD